ncbi:hypothetical protein OY671_009747, partial [Metschnikowia pulcherrima]
SADPHRHHRGRRQHPDAQPDHLRPGRDPSPSLCAGRDARGAVARPQAGPDRFRPRLSGPCRFRDAQQTAHAGHVADRRPLRRHRRRRRARDEALLPAAEPLFGRLRTAGRHLDAGAGRQPQAPRTPVGAPGRHPVADVPGQRRAQALRGRRPPGRRRAAGASVGAGRAVPPAGRHRRRAGKLSQPRGGVELAPHR